MYEYEDGEGEAGATGAGGDDTGGGDGGATGGADTGDTGDHAAPTPLPPLTEREYAGVLAKAKAAGEDTAAWDYDKAAAWAKTTTKHKVKIGTEELEVPLEELIRGYQRQSDYTKKTQEIARQRAEYEAQTQALTNSEAYKALKAAAEAETGDFDPYDPDAYLKHMRKEIAAQLAQSLKPIEEETNKRKQNAVYNEFLAAHPELKDDDFREEVAKELEKNPGLTTPLAYEVIKGRRLAKELAEQQGSLDAYKQAVAKAGLTIGSGGGSAPQTSGPIAPKHIRKDPVAFNAWLKAQGVQDDADDW